MPKIYLSPSTQEFNEYVTGGNEEYYMNLVADALEPYLYASGIGFTRNSPEMTAAQSIKASNSGNYNFHLALHSNAAPDIEAGQRRGIEIYYSPYSYNGKRMAQIMVDNFKIIYPYPSLVKAVETTYLGEVTRTKAPAVLAEIGYHDNEEDANWIINNIESIARVLALSLTEYFSLSFIEPTLSRRGKVDTVYTPLNIRSRPNTVSPILAQAPPGAILIVNGVENDNWYSVDYNGTVGFASKEYITLLDR